MRAPSPLSRPGKSFGAAIRSSQPRYIRPSNAFSSGESGLLMKTGTACPTYMESTKATTHFPFTAPAAYIADQWIAALLAGEELSRRFNDPSFTEWCRDVRRRASGTAENLLWNGNYYDLAHDAVTGRKSSICFVDQFTHGTLAARILNPGRAPPARPRRTESAAPLATERRTVQVRLPKWAATPTAAQPIAPPTKSRKGSARNPTPFRRPWQRLWRPPPFSTAWSLKASP